MSITIQSARIAHQGGGQPERAGGKLRVRSTNTTVEVSSSPVSAPAPSATTAGCKIPPPISKSRLCETHHIMNSNTFIATQTQSSAGFDLVRLSKSKQHVDLCSNTLREYNRAGLPFYRRGKAVFFSKNELNAFLRSN